MKKNLLVSLSLLLLFAACGLKPDKQTFIKVKDGQFIKDGQPYYYIGANFWYGAILASEGEGGNRQRLLMELDSLCAIGVDNLRILVGADGVNGIVSKVEPTLQIAPGVYNDTILAGLDYLLYEMGKRKMSAVLYLNNSWEWSGGYGQYLEWAGYGKAPVPTVDGWAQFQKFVEQYPQCDSSKTLFANHVKFIVERTNRYINRKYSDDSTIMSWQIGNEPRAFNDKNKVSFALWIHSVAELIKSCDPNHLVSTGSEGSQGCEKDIQLWELIHSYKSVDYMTIHIWPYNWKWTDKDSLNETLDYSIKQTQKYIKDHLAIAEKYNKPIVIEEFGYPRDSFLFDLGTLTSNRDAYYASVFQNVVDGSESNGNLAGCNFWAWGGMAEKKDGCVYWVKGNDYTGDPPQEEQGLYSVFQKDNTVELIRNSNKKISNH